MGNYISCTLSRSSNSSIKVIFPKTGEIKQFNYAIKAAELMLESPGTFLANTSSLRPGKRFFALNADEDLERGNIYVMFPMKRVNSVVSTADMGTMFLTAKRISGVRVLPEPEAVVAEKEELTAVKKLNLDDIDDLSIIEFKHRMSLCRSKKPLLETIAEEPACLRR